MRSLDARAWNADQRSPTQDRTRSSSGERSKHRIDRRCRAKSERHRRKRGRGKGNTCGSGGGLIQREHECEYARRQGTKHANMGLHPKNTRIWFPSAMGVVHAAKRNYQKYLEQNRVLTIRLVFAIERLFEALYAHGAT